MNTLSRSSHFKEGRSKTKPKVKNVIESEKTSDTITAISPTFSEPCKEFSTSEDEGTNLENKGEKLLLVSFCY